MGIPSQFKSVFEAKAGEERIQAWLNLDKDDAGNFKFGVRPLYLPSHSFHSTQLT